VWLYQLELWCPITAAKDIEGYFICQGKKMAMCYGINRSEWSEFKIFTECLNTSIKNWL
jgi:hypothetical protein